MASEPAEHARFGLLSCSWTFRSRSGILRHDVVHPKLSLHTICQRFFLSTVRFCRAKWFNSKKQTTPAGYWKQFNWYTSKSCFSCILVHYAPLTPSLDKSSFQFDEYAYFDLLSMPPNNMRGTSARALGLSKIVWGACQTQRKLLCSV